MSIPAHHTLDIEGTMRTISFLGPSINISLPVSAIASSSVVEIRRVIYGHNKRFSQSTACTYVEYTRDINLHLAETKLEVHL